jgi:hypothetical protein|tara:strand:- start:162 stop:332 length:171 start_codon:yes stop_codon:yes gene_type:complete
MQETQEKEEGMWVPYDEVTKYLDMLSMSLLNLATNIKDTVKKMDEFIEAKEIENNE